VMRKMEADSLADLVRMAATLKLPLAGKTSSGSRIPSSRMPDPSRYSIDSIVQ